MSLGIGKTEQSKRRVRREGAALSFADKLRVVERLRDETIVRLPKEEDGGVQKRESGITPSQSLLLEMIQHTVENQRRGRELSRGGDDGKRWEAEVEELFAKRERGLEALQALFPEGIPPNPVFYDRLADLETRLGWSETTQRATGLLLLLAVEQLPLDSGEALLREMPRMASPQFFQMLESLPVLVADLELRPEFAAEWLPALLRRIGNDLASDGFWKALGVYCERHAQSALDTLHCLSPAQSEEAVSVAAYILGTVRSLNLEDATHAHFNKLETEFSTSLTVGTRSIYHRSWIQTAWRGRIQKSDLDSLTSRMIAGSSDEQERVFWIVTRSLLSPSIPGDCFNFGLAWLRAHASGTLSPAAKYRIIDFAAQLPGARVKEAGELVLLVQPVLAEHKGIWQRVEHFLVAWLKKDLPGFSDFCVELAKMNAHNWLEALKAPQSFDWFLSELRGHDVGNFVGQLFLSPSSDCRKLGLFLFDELDMSEFPAAMLNTAGENQVRVVFYELQRGLMHGQAIARCLISLIPSALGSSSDFQNEFYDELVFQAENYPGSCRAEFERRMDEFSILRQAIEEVDRYFEALRQIRESSINAMEVTGYCQAARLYRRRISKEVNQHSEETSVFAQFYKQVRLLYGKRWSSFHDGKLGESSGLQRISTSFEIPRIEGIDPEGMELRWHHASTKIEEIGKCAHAEGGKEKP